VAGECLPFSEPAGPIRSLGGFLVRVPTDDHRCLWIGEQVTTSAGAFRNIAFEPDRQAPFGACPTKASLVGGVAASIVHVDSGDDPSILVQIASAYRFAGSTKVLYRLFKVDPAAIYGATELGSGIGRWDATTQRIVVPGPSALPFSEDLGLGDAAFTTAGYAYIWGCAKPGPELLRGCLVARIGMGNSLSLFTSSGTWVAGAQAGDAATVFDAGPWISSVVPDPTSGGLLHVYASDFGGDLRTDVGSAPEGPWAPAATLGPCALPSDDPQAFCAGPVVHSELQDPTRPGEVAVSYGVASTATDADARVAANPAAYWTHLAWRSAP
jgi:hypothetical protein